MKTEWIKFEDQLPKDYQRVLFLDAQLMNPEINIGYFVFPNHPNFNHPYSGVKQMTAQDARNITIQHSIRMKQLYKRIEEAAMRGQKEITETIGDMTSEEMDILKKEGFSVGYEYAKEDGMQFISIKW